jgi:dCMP deaminase
MDYSSKAISEYLKHSLSQKTCCLKHPIGAVIESGGIYVFGWSGAPSGIEHNECSRKGYPSGKGMEKCPAIHAERRAISYAAKKGISLSNGTIYLSEWFPCAECAKSIIEAGIEKLVTPDEFYQDKESRILIPKLHNQTYNFEMAEKLLVDAKIKMIVDSSIRP